MISTHILDTHLGKPASDVQVQLFFDEKLIAQAQTNADGRIHTEDFALSECVVGNYHLEFAVGRYFEQQHLETFFPKVVVHFSIHDLNRHYHIPVLISPFAYSSYRGS